MEEASRAAIFCQIHEKHLKTEDQYLFLSVGPLITHDGDFQSFVSVFPVDLKPVCKQAAVPQATSLCPVVAADLLHHVMSLLSRFMFVPEQAHVKSNFLAIWGGSGSMASRHFQAKNSKFCYLSGTSRQNIRLLSRSTRFGI